MTLAYSKSGTAAGRAVMSRSAGAVRGFDMCPVMQAVFNVREEQGRAADVPDHIIASILNHPVNITYKPLECKRVVVNPMYRVGFQHLTYELILKDTISLTCMSKIPLYLVRKILQICSP
ncbi:hypothetical protein KIN20_030773 [Parelaphostrongylus tenuis]|uniref:Uncharacterized protein n=1 Tax=Parelaphostrongylus tenuis TaxID=148309 RepID=A0AAD5R4H0_PARTN|nr:hypothetical protein KIN20_030773 [Parelaphostrongylus tenuis]